MDDLVLEVAPGSRVFTCLNRRPRQHDTVDLLLHQRLHRQRHGQIRFPRPGYANAENNILLLNRLDVFPLISRLGRDLFLTSGIKARLGEIVAQTKGAIFGNLSEGFATPVCKLRPSLNRSEKSCRMRSAVSTSLGSPSIKYPTASVDADGQQ